MRPGPATPGPRLAAQPRRRARTRAWRWRTPLLVAALGLVAVLAPVAVPLASSDNPLLSGMQPAPGSTVDAGSITVLAQVEASSVVTVERVEVRVDGLPHDTRLIREHDVYTVTTSLELPAGPHTAQVVVWDERGRNTQAWWRFEVAGTREEQFAVAGEVEGTASQIAGDGATRPDLEPAPGEAVTELARVVIGVDYPVEAAASNVRLIADGEKIPVTLQADGNRLIAEVGEPPDGLAEGGPLAVRVVAAVGGTSREAVEVDYEFTWRRPPVTRTEEGFLLAERVGPAVGEGALYTYTLEVEPDAGVDAHAFADEAERILSDPRGWTGRGEFAVQRVQTVQAAIRMVLATPETVDRSCAEAGLDTQGRYSCWNGRFAMLNVERWLGAVAGFEGDVDTYRVYLVNHEFGHGLGFGHVDCPASGEPAPVMQQQSIDLQGCRPNGWPFPDVSR